MPNRFPISTESTDKTPMATMEIILRLKVKDAMVANVLSAKKSDTLREIQLMMKENEISGVPVLDENRLVGMISVNDIINALDRNYIHDKVEKHMVRNLIVLEDDMPLTFAVSYFNKYTYRRFPVINKEKEFVGILSTKDVLAALLFEMNKEINALESRLVSVREEVPNQIALDFVIKRFDFENAGTASFKLKKLLKDKNVDRKVLRRASVSAYELEINVAIHSFGGSISFILDRDRITIIAKDNGPGILNVDEVCEEGFSTANEWIRSLGFGAGMGLPNTKRVSDEFTITSQVGVGTTVTSVIFLEAKNEGE